MKQLSTLCCAALILTSCASGRPEPMVSGRCGNEQNTCVRGTPTDTTSPHRWICVGTNGGASMPCSERAFTGQNDLVARIKAEGPMRGLFTIIDPTFGESDDLHARSMVRIAEEMRIPNQNLHIGKDNGPYDIFGGGEKDANILEETLVYAFPSAKGLYLGDRAESINRYNHHLLVMAAGNTDTFAGRQLWYPNHRHWQENPGLWERGMSVLADGRVILAKNAKLDHDGTVIPNEKNVMCGLAKEYCYSIIAEGNPGTSSASIQLGALAFYLAQLWDTPKEVVGVLNTCAEDVGELGIDEEFGRGIVSVACDTVRNRELTAVANSVETFGDSPMLIHLTAERHSAIGAALGSPQPQSMTVKSLPTALSIRPFYAVRGRSLETITGHLGGQFSMGGPRRTDFFISGGTDYAPLGVYSSLLRASRTPFMEFGTKQHLFSRNGHAVSILGIYGHGRGNSLSTHTEHVGARYERQFRHASLAFHAGYQRIRGQVGIPGYREAGSSPAPFSKNSPEVRLHFSFLN